MSYEPANGLLDIFTPGYSAATNAYGAASDAACNAKANAAQRGLDDLQALTASTWLKTTRVFSASMVIETFDQTFAMLTEASATIERQRRQNVSDKEALRGMQAVLLRKMEDGRELILRPTQAAMAAGAKQVASDALRHWVLTSMSESATAYYAVALSQCQQPWFIKALEVIKAIVDKIIAIVKRIAKFIADAAELVVELPGDVWRTMVTVMKVCGVGAVAYLAYKHRDKLKALRK